MKKNPGRRERRNLFFSNRRKYGAQRGKLPRGPRLPNYVEFGQARNDAVEDVQDLAVQATAVHARSFLERPKCLCG